MRILGSLAALAALALVLPASVLAASSSAMMASQKVPNDEVLRWVYQVPFPVACGAAQRVAAGLRVKPTTDVATMHNAIKEYVACAKSPTGQHVAGLANGAFFGAAAAALLAARQETGQAAATDAFFARDVSQDLINYNRTPMGSSNPSVVRTNASRINADAVALIGVLGTSAPVTHPIPPAPAHS